MNEATNEAPYSDAMMKCPLLSWHDTVNASPLEILECIPGMIRAAAHECGKKHQKRCQEGHCFVGSISECGDHEFFNELDVTASESEFPERVKSENLKVWIFAFCPQCGSPIDRVAMAQALGRQSDDCGA